MIKNPYSLTLSPNGGTLITSLPGSFFGPWPILWQWLETNHVPNDHMVRRGGWVWRGGMDGNRGGLRGWWKSGLTPFPDRETQKKVKKTAIQKSRKQAGMQAGWQAKGAKETWLKAVPTWQKTCGHCWLYNLYYYDVKITHGKQKRGSMTQLDHKGTTKKKQQKQSEKGAK